MRTRIVVFPGSNCDHDAMYAVKHVMGEPDTEFVWHKQESIGEGVNLVILPGGFSYGDYLRTGAIARFSPVMKDVIRFANEGGIVVGICNGFQILCESGLLPGVLIRNQSLKFICRPVHLRTENTDSIFSSELHHHDVLEIPVAHGEGNYMATDEVLQDLELNKQVIFRYCGPHGELDQAYNLNGSMNNIAGLMNAEGNVFGMMPHPERACEKMLGSADGLKILNSIRESIRVGAPASL
jgi:phosphoribosylformylglycinamidine synthase subunit PurQ / glutaminase